MTLPVGPSSCCRAPSACARPTHYAQLERLTTHFGPKAGAAESPDPIAAPAIEQDTSINPNPSRSLSDEADGAANASNVYASYSYKASGYPTAVKTQALSSVVPSTAFASAFDPLTLPGPIFEEAGGTNVLFRAMDASSALKSMRAAHVEHLDVRIRELSAGFRLSALTSIVLWLNSRLEHRRSGPG